MLRLVRHLKLVSLKNVPRVLSNLIFGSRNKNTINDTIPHTVTNNQLSVSETESLYRRILFGKK